MDMATCTLNRRKKVKIRGSVPSRCRNGHFQMHRLLLRKIKAYGIEGKLLAWIEAWLMDRKQRVVVGSAKSSWLEVVSGTTQGTVLGFLLFLVFITDLPRKCSSEDESLITLLADDTKTY